MAVRHIGGLSVGFWVILQVAIPGAEAFVLNPVPTGNRLVMNLDLLPTTTFQTIGYGEQSWNSLAEGALAAWNQVGVGKGLDFNFFSIRVPTVTGNQCSRDGVNEVRWTTDVCGRSFGTALAVTTTWGVNGQRVEADVVLNTNPTVKWNAYPGPLKPASGGGTLNDFVRVAMHEFGHAIGLDHPDEAGQTVSALMNARTSNVDRLEPDDIEGAHAIEWVPPQAALSVTVVGNGTVTSSPAGLTCATGTCLVTFAQGTGVRLTATPTAEATFTGWSGACTGLGPCAVTMASAQAVTATFTAPQTVILTVTLAGGGSGTVTSSPGGITCTSGTCLASVSSGTPVTLTATAASGSTFTGWSGGGCSGTGTCTVTMQSTHAVTATFTLIQQAVQSAVSVVSVTLNGTQFRSGDTLTVGIAAQHPIGTSTADLYAGVILADGQTIVFFTGPGLFSPATTVATPAQFTRMQAAPAGFVLSAPAFFQLTIPATGIPAGTYVFFAGLVTPGAFLDNRIDPGDILAFDSKALTLQATLTVAQQAYLKASNTEFEDVFGFSVALSGDTLVVGAPSEDSCAVGIGGDQANNSCNNAGAVYVFTRTGGVWSQQAYVKASNTRFGGGFGGSVALSGDTLAVGAPEETSCAVGIGGDQANNSCNNAGAVYVFTRTGGVWSQQAYVKASNTRAFAQFGNRVALSGDTLAVGAGGENSCAVGVNGDQAANSCAAAGAVYVFTRTGGVPPLAPSWSQQAYVKASNSEGLDVFGSSVALSGDTLVVGAPSEDSSATGVNGNEADNSLLRSGAAYVFTRTGGVWSQQAYLKASNAGAANDFGVSVAVSGDTLVVGASGENSSATGVNGNQTNNTGPGSVGNSGAAYVFTRTNGVWSQQAYLKAFARSNPQFSHAGESFGSSVALAGDTLVVGAVSEGSGVTGVNSTQIDTTGVGSGAAYVFTRTGGVWSQQAYLKASNTERGDAFGFSVALSGDTVVAGALRESSNSIGVNGNQTNNSAFGSGAVYVFVAQ